MAESEVKALEELRAKIRAELAEMRKHHKPIPAHRDRHERPCSGYFTFDRNVSNQGRRSCNWCKREETYSPTQLIIIFKKGISTSRAAEFILGLRFRGHALSPASGEKRVDNLVEKKGLVGATVSISLTAGKLEEWIQKLAEEGKELLWIIEPVMVAAFPADSSGKDPKTQDQGHRQGRRDFPDEFAGRP